MSEIFYSIFRFIGLFFLGIMLVIYSLIQLFDYWLVHTYPTIHRKTTSFFLSAIFLPRRYENIFSTDLESIYLNPWYFVDICQFHL